MGILETYFYLSLYLLFSDSGITSGNTIAVGTPIEFLIPSKAEEGVEMAPSIRHLGVISRPEGKRRFWVEDGEGVEYLINR
jgi:hypothetical protein